MTELYYYSWEFVTSSAIIIAVVMYILNDQIKIRKARMEENGTRPKGVWRKLLKDVLPPPEGAVIDNADGQEKA